MDKGDITITIKMTSNDVSLAQGQYDALVKALLELRGLDLPGVTIDIVLTTVKDEGQQPQGNGMP